MSAGPVGKLQHQHSSAGQGFSPKVAQQLGLHRPGSGQDGQRASSDGQATHSNGPIMTFGQPPNKPQHQPTAAPSRYAQYFHTDSRQSQKINAVAIATALLFSFACSFAHVSKAAACENSEHGAAR